MNDTYQHINSPNNNSNLILFLKKIYCSLLLVGICSLGFSQKKIDPNGFNQFFYESGELASEGNFVNGVPDGLWKSYYLDGQLKSKGLKNAGASDSLWFFYREDGTIESTYNYENDLKNGCATFYDSSETKTNEVFFVDGKRQGESLWFYPNGKIKKKLIYEDDRENGIAFLLDSNGFVIIEEEYSNGYLRDVKKYNQLDENGNKTGVWRAYFPNGQIKSETSYKEGLKDGLSKEYDKDGKLLSINTMSKGNEASDPGGIVIIDLYKEYFDNGEVRLIGGLNKGKKSGIYREYDREGNLVRAYIYKLDTLLSEGMLLAGGIFTDEWINYYPDGTIKSKGSFNNGLKDGKWIYYYPDGKKEQEGKFKENVLNGSWVWYYSNGQIKKTEQFNRKGLLEGELIEYDSLGNEITKGEYYNGLQEGSWFYHVGDFKEVGSFIGGAKDGQWIHYYQNGKIAFRGNYSDGEAKGKHYYYHQNGIKKKIGKYAGGQKHGIWRTFSDKAEIIETIHYKAGEVFKINGFKINKIEE